MANDRSFQERKRAVKAKGFRQLLNRDRVKPLLDDMLRRLTQFTVSGAIGILVDTFVLYTLVESSPLVLPLVDYKLIAAEAAIVNNFIWNDLWTFRDRRTGGIGYNATGFRIFKFNLVSTLGLAVAVATLYILHAGLHLNLYLANLFAIVIAAMSNFFLSHALAWTAPRSRSEVSSSSARNAVMRRLLETGLQETRIFHCKHDGSDSFNQGGSSDEWNTAINGKPIDANRTNQNPDNRVLFFDFEARHRDQQNRDHEDGRTHHYYGP